MAINYRADENYDKKNGNECSFYLLNEKLLLSTFYCFMEGFDLHKAFPLHKFFEPFLLSRFF